VNDLLRIHWCRTFIAATPVQVHPGHGSAGECPLLLQPDIRRETFEGRVSTIKGYGCGAIV
jgi:hypothetical protein